MLLKPSLEHNHISARHQCTTVSWSVDVFEFVETQRILGFFPPWAPSFSNVNQHWLLVGDGMQTAVSPCQSHHPTDVLQEKVLWHSNNVFCFCFWLTGAHKSDILNAFHEPTCCHSYVMNKISEYMSLLLSFENTWNRTDIIADTDEYSNCPVAIVVWHADSLLVCFSDG